MFYIFHPEQKLISFAGIYSYWKDPILNTYLWTYSILTAVSKGKMLDLHERMPVCISKKDYSNWLNPQQNDAKIIQSHFDSELSKEFDYKPVSKKVNEIGLADL